MPKTKQDQEARSYWSEGGQIFFNGGRAWGVAPDLRSLCLSSEAEITKALDEKKGPGDPVTDDILRQELNNRGKQKISSRATTRRRRVKNKAFTPLRYRRT